MITIEIPLKPFKDGKIANKFGGPAKSPKEVLERTRIALSPRGAWSHRGLVRKTHEGHARCLVQAFSDVDGIHADAARLIMIKAANEITGRTYTSVPSFNDDEQVFKHHVIMALDRAIEMA